VPDLTPERLSLLDQARSEARDDLGRLMSFFEGKREADGEDVAVADVVQGLLDAPSWDRLNLASVLGEALARLTTSEVS
jgi:hypothetical protein